MNTTRVLTGIALSSLLTTAPAWAAAGSGGTRVYSSGMLVLVFIGICALVVLAQMIPALMTAWGMLKGIGKEQGRENAAKA